MRYILVVAMLALCACVTINERPGGEGNPPECAQGGAAGVGGACGDEAGGTGGAGGVTMPGPLPTTTSSSKHP